MTNTKNAVQGSVKIIPADEEGKVLVDSDFPEYLDKEITVYYYIGFCFTYFSSMVAKQLIFKRFN